MRLERKKEMLKRKMLRIRMLKKFGCFDKNELIYVRQDEDRPGSWRHVSSFWTIPKSLTEIVKKYD